MGGWFTFLAPFLGTPKDYDDVLKKVAGASFYITYIASFFLRDAPGLEPYVSALESSGPLGSLLNKFPDAVQVNVTGFAVALLVAILSYNMKIHDRISDIFGIRKVFDRRYIIAPLALRVGVSLTPSQFENFDANRHEIMRAVFYKFASSRAPNPLVDRHEIEHALSAWTVLWILVEGILLLSLSAAIAWWAGSPLVAGNFVLVVGFFLLLCIPQSYRLRRYALAEVEAIASDPEASRQVREKLHAL